MTVDWSNWLKLNAREQDQLWAKYRQVVADEIQHSKATNWKALNDAVYGRRP